MSSILFQRPTANAVMVRVPKTASTSVVRGIFGGINDTDTIVHGPPPENWSEHFSFAFVRNPFDRLISALLMFARYRTETASEAEFKEGISVDRVLDVILDESQSLVDENYFSKLRRHVIPMTHPFFGLGKVEKIYRFEEFPAAYHELGIRFKVRTEEIPHFRKTDRKPYQEYFSADQQIRARKILQQDCDTFGYAF